MQDRPDDRLPPEGEAAARRGEGLIENLARKAVASSVGAILSSEDGIKQIIAAIVPKEVGQYVARELAVLRAEALKAMMAEVSRFLDRVDPAKEVQKVLEGLAFDIHVTVAVRRAAGAGPAEVSPEAHPALRPEAAQVKAGAGPTPAGRRKPGNRKARG